MITFLFGNFGFAKGEEGGTLWKFGNCVPWVLQSFLTFNSSRQTYETYADPLNLEGKWTDNKFAAGENETTRYVNKPKLRLSDLGIGKFVPIQYPWNPKNSPNLCKNAGKAVDETGQKNEDNTKNIYPGTDCDEFVFTKS